MWMNRPESPAPENLQRELDETRDRLRETEYLLNSIQTGKADALLIHGPEGEQVHSLKSFDVLVDSIIDHSVGATVLLDGTGEILRASRTAEDLFLYNPTGRHFDEAFPLFIVDAEEPNGEERPPVRFRIRQVLDGATINGLETAFIRVDGTTLSLLLAAKPLTPFGGLFKGALVTLLDLTPRKKAEVQLLVRNKQLRYQFELTKTITDNTSEALFLTDAEGRIHFLNPSAEKMFGWTAGQLMDRTLHETMHPHHHPSVFPLGMCGLGRLADSTAAEIHEDYFAHADGHSIAVRYSKSPVLNEGRITGAVYAVEDISARKTSEEALRLSEEKLRQSQKMEAVGRLAGGIAHDFNNLLTAINGYAGLGLAMVEPEDSLHGYLDEIRKSGERAASLTSQLLSYSRKQILSPKVLDFNAIVKDTVSIVQRILGEDIRFDVEPSSEPCLVNVDPVRIQQVLVNLAINARDAMPEGGILRMQTRAVQLAETDRSGLLGEIARDSEEGAQPGRYVQFSITDDGAGMDDNVKAHLFEPFFTTKEVGRGTGLGLSMAYGIVKQHRGHIQIFSEAGQGTTVNILLPASRPGRPLRPGKSDVPGPQGGDETLLVAEDESVVLSLIRNVLKAGGYTVLEASNGAEALEVSDRYEKPIHLLITDVVMNRMGGHELAEALKVRRPGMPQIFISGYNEDLVLRREIRNERILFLQKPFSPDALLRLVRQTLDEAHAPAQEG